MQTLSPRQVPGSLTRGLASTNAPGLPGVILSKVPKVGQDSGRVFKVEKCQHTPQFDSCCQPTKAFEAWVLVQG